MLRRTGNVFDAYLDAEAGRQVLHGSIKWGAGEPIRAIIWTSDLRSFTVLADRLPGPQMIGLLNAHFKRIAEAVMNHDGALLKFAGDGLLAVFPFSVVASEKAEASLTVAEEALAAIERLNAAPPDEFREVIGWQPLRSGIALHEGKVIFGNVGTPARGARRQLRLSGRAQPDRGQLGQCELSAGRRAADLVERRAHRKSSRASIFLRRRPGHRAS